MRGPYALRAMCFCAVGALFGALLALPAGYSRALSKASAPAAETPTGSAITAGPIQIIPHPELKTSIFRDAVYYLDYHAGKLVVSIPPETPSANSQTLSGRLFAKKREDRPAQRSMLRTLAERDLVADFKLAPTSPARFSMVTGQSGETWANLYVLEATSRRINTYRSSTKRNTDGGTAPIFELLESELIGNPGDPPLGEIAVIAGPVYFNPAAQGSMSHDAIYVLERESGRFWVSVPMLIRIASSRKILEPFTSVDARKDMAIAPDAPATFLMTMGRVGMMTAPVYVFETESRKIGVYGVQARMAGGRMDVSLQCLETRSIATIE